MFKNMLVQINTTVDVDFNDIVESYGIDVILDYISENGYRVLKTESLKDVLKFEAFAEKFDNIPESDLDDFISKY